MRKPTRKYAEADKNKFEISCAVLDHLVPSCIVVSCRFVPSCAVSCRIFLLLAFCQNGNDLLMHGSFRILKTFDEVVDQLGGKAAVGSLCEGQDTAAVCNWRRRRKMFPTKYYPVMRDELNKRGFDAPDDLWGFYKKNKKR